MAGLDLLRKQIGDHLTAGEKAVMACSALKKCLYRDVCGVSDQVKLV
jgi:gluconate kinase